MEGFTSSLLNLPRPFPLHSSSSSSLFLNTRTTKRPTSLIAKAELDDSSNGGGEAKKPSGFGAAAAEPTKSSKKKRGKERSSTIIRRDPIERPAVFNKEESGASPQGEGSLNENAFLLTWLGLGLLIFVEGIALSASGFLPEEWDNFLVKYLYPSFTPTVFLFVGGTVVYGVYKYLQGEKMKS